MMAGLANLPAGAVMAGDSTPERLRDLLRRVLEKCKVPSTLREEIEAALTATKGRPAMDLTEAKRLLAEPGATVTSVAEKLKVTRPSLSRALSAEKLRTSTPSRKKSS